MNDDILLLDLPVVDDVADWADQLVPDLSGDPATWGPNLINWGLQNWVHILDNVYGEHEYTQNTSVNLSNSVTGNAIYYYQDKYGSAQSCTGRFSFIPSAVDVGYTVAMGPHVQFNVISEGSGNWPAVNTSLSGGSLSNITLDTGRYTVQCYIDGQVAQYSSSSVTVLKSLNKIYYYNGNMNTSYYGFGQLSAVGFTSNPTVKSANPHALYVPSGDYNYNTYKDAIIQQFNDENPDTAVDPDDYPDFQQVLEEVHPTEPTEPTEPGTGGGSCNIDYDEILSEGELESILNQETYELLELDTNLPSLSFELPEATLPANQIGLLADTLTMSYNFWDGLGLSSFLIALGVLAALFRLLQR